MKILLPTTIAAVVLGVTTVVAADTSSSTPQQQLRRNAQEIPEVAATADATASMVGVDAVDMVWGGDCIMMCEVSEL